VEEQRGQLLRGRVEELPGQPRPLLLLAQEQPVGQLLQPGGGRLQRARPLGQPVEHGVERGRQLVGGRVAQGPGRNAGVQVAAADAPGGLLQAAQGAQRRPQHRPVQHQAHAQPADGGQDHQPGGRRIG
jgi:hypothetical protein